MWKLQWHHSRRRSLPGSFSIVSRTSQRIYSLKDNVVSRTTKETSIWFSQWNKSRKSAESSKNTREWCFTTLKKHLVVFQVQSCGKSSDAIDVREIHDDHPNSIRGNVGSCPTSNRVFEHLSHDSRIETRVCTCSYRLLHLLGGNTSGDSRRWRLLQHSLPLVQDSNNKRITKL